MGVVGSGWGVEGSSEKEKGLVDMDNSVAIAGWGGGIRGINGNRKNTIKILQIMRNK